MCKNAGIQGDTADETNAGQYGEEYPSFPSHWKAGYCGVRPFYYPHVRFSWSVHSPLLVVVVVAFCWPKRPEVLVGLTPVGSTQPDRVVLFTHITTVCIAVYHNQLERDKMGASRESLDGCW